MVLGQVSFGSGLYVILKYLDIFRYLGKKENLSSLWTSKDSVSSSWRLLGRLIHADFGLLLGIDISTDMTQSRHSKQLSAE